MGEEREDECTSNFFVGDIWITAKNFGSCEDGETYFISYTKEYYKSDLQSPLEPHNEEENKATPLGCEPKNLVEEQATLVSLREDGKVKNMDNKSFDFCRSHVHLQPSDPWKDKNSSLASEDCKRKANCEGNKFTLVSLLVITKLVKRKVMLSMVIRYIFHNIQNNNKYHILIRHLNFLMKWKTSPHQLGVN